MNNNYKYPFTSYIDIDEYIRQNQNIVKQIIESPDLFQRKWEGVIDNFFEKLKITSSIYKDLCVYSEVASRYYDYLHELGYKITGAELSDILNDIKLKILEKEPERSAIVRKVYNYQSGFVEYELENGKYVKIVNESVIGPRSDVSKDIFPDEFLKHIDLSLYRDNKIDKLI